MSNKIKIKPINLLVTASLLMGFVGLVSHAQQVNADSLNAGPLTVSYAGSGPIFSQINYAPGDSTTKILTVTNNGTVSHSFALATRNVTGVLADKLYLQPIVSGSPVWSKTVQELSSLPTESQTVVASINPGQTVSIELKADLDSSAGNAYQAKNVTFDLVSGTQEAEPTATATTTVTPTATSSDTTAGDTTASTTGGTTGILGRIRSFFTRDTATPVATASPTLTATITPEVKGTETGNVEGAANFFNKNKNWLLLLITPIAAAIALMIPTMGSTLGMVIPLVGGIVALILSYFIPGNLKAYIFWIILGAEVVLTVVMNYILLKKDRVEADSKEKKKN